MKPFIYDYTYEQLRDWAVEQGEPAFRGGQIFD